MKEKIENIIPNLPIEPIDQKEIHEKYIKKGRVLDSSRKPKSSVSPFLKLQIVKEHENGVTFKALEEKYNISDSSIVSWYRKYKKEGENGILKILSRGKEGGVINAFWDNPNLNFIATDITMPYPLFLYTQNYFRNNGYKNFSSFVLELLFNHFKVKNYDDIFMILSKQYNIDNEEDLINILKQEIDLFPKRKTKNISSNKVSKKVPIRPPRLIWNYFTLENLKIEDVSLTNFIINLILTKLNFENMDYFFQFLEKKYGTTDTNKLKKILETNK